jgi:hypothetical protein
MKATYKQVGSLQKNFQEDPQSTLAQRKTEGDRQQAEIHWYSISTICAELIQLHQQNTGTVQEKTLHPSLSKTSSFSGWSRTAYYLFFYF